MVVIKSSIKAFIERTECFLLYGLLSCRITISLLMEKAKVNSFHLDTLMSIFCYLAEYSALKALINMNHFSSEIQKYSIYIMNLLTVWFM